MTIVCAIGLWALVAGAPPGGSVEFDGERYTARFHSYQAELRLVEYVRESETIDNWTKLFAVRNFPQHDNPEAAVAAFERVVKQHNPLARMQTLYKQDGSEAMIDFMTWETGQDQMEFNVHRYLRKPGHPGLISFQFAYRFRADSTDAEKLRALRERWTELMRAAEPAIEFAK